MTAAKKPGKAAPKGAASAAAAEVAAEPQAKTVTFRDVSLELPDELPATILFDITELESAGSSPMPLFRLLRSLLGPEQFQRVRAQLQADDDVMGAVEGLIGDVFAEYGMGLGDS